MINEKESSLHLFKGGGRFGTLVFLILSAISVTYFDINYKFLGVVRQYIATALIPIQEAALWPRDALRYSKKYFTNIDSLSEENKKLKDSVRLLRLNQQQVSKYIEDNKRLRALLGLRTKLKKKVLSVQVSRINSDGFNKNAIFINKGADNGIKRGMAVISGSGLVGQIKSVLPKESELLLVGDKNLSIPVTVEPGGARALAQGDSGRKDLVLRFFGSRGAIATNSLVFTSGIGGGYPEGLLVCKIKSGSIGVKDLSGLLRCSPTAVSKGKTFLVILN